MPDFEFQTAHRRSPVRERKRSWRGSRRVTGRSSTGPLLSQVSVAGWTQRTGARRTGAFIGDDMVAIMTVNPQQGWMKEVGELRLVVHPEACVARASRRRRAPCRRRGDRDGTPQAVRRGAREPAPGDRHVHRAGFDRRPSSATTSSTVKADRAASASSAGSSRRDRTTSPTATGDIVKAAVLNSIPGRSTSRTSRSANPARRGARAHCGGRGLPQRPALHGGQVPVPVPGGPRARVGAESSKRSALWCTTCSRATTSSPACRRSAGTARSAPTAISLSARTSGPSSSASRASRRALSRSG